jgi:heme-degrading monooxygenase HmoA
MILEVAVLDVRAGCGAGYEAAFRDASRIIPAMPGCISLRFLRA